MTTLLCFCHELNRSIKELPHRSFGAILRTLASYANPNGDNCYPNIRRVARSCGYSVGWVHACLTWAQENGWLVINRASGVSKGQGWRRNSYRLVVPHWRGGGRRKRTDLKPRRCSPSTEHLRGGTPYNKDTSTVFNKPKGVGAWNLLRNAIPRYGRYNPPSEENNFHAMCARTIAIIRELGGWGTLCLSMEFDLNTRIRSQFLQFWSE